MVTALSGAGLRIERLRELPVDVRQRLPSMIRGEDGYWRLRGDPLPMLFTCVATRPQRIWRQRARPGNSDSIGASGTLLSGSVFRSSEPSPLGESYMGASFGIGTVSRFGTVRPRVRIPGPRPSF